MDSLLLTRTKLNQVHVATGTEVALKAPRRNVIAINQGVASERKLREQLERMQGAKTPGVLGRRGEEGWQPS